jgi:hypothetical protein
MAEISRSAEENPSQNGREVSAEREISAKTLGWDG